MIATLFASLMLLASFYRRVFDLVCVYTTDLNQKRHLGFALSIDILIT